MTNYEGIRDALYYRESWQHGSSRAERLDSEYLVWSYKTLILRYSLNGHKVLYFDNRYHSNTTSRLQNLIREEFNVNRFEHRVIYDGDMLPEF